MPLSWQCGLPDNRQACSLKGMTMTDRISPPSDNRRPDFKQQAKRLRLALAESGRAISHGEALEMVARQHGHRDWNTLSAATGRPSTESPSAASPLAVGRTVTGRYLGQPFTGEIRSVTALADGAHWRLAIHFAEPVDVVTFESFSAFRRRIHATVNGKGISPQRTSDGQPHLVIDP